MIETTLHTVDGVRFYSWKIVGPIERLNGVPVEYVDQHLSTEIDVKLSLKAMRFRRVGEDLSRRADIYARYPAPFLSFKTVEVFLVIYWHLVRWLYDNARMFKRIPEGQRFSWHYFTPYTWFKGVPR